MSTATSTDAPTLEEVWRLFRETDRQFKETDRQFKETDRRLRETGERIRELSELFTGQWGKLVEALVRPGLLEQFQRRGIPVHETLERDRVRRGGREMELDVTLINDGVVIPVEVKTTLRVEDVRDFLERLRELKVFYPKYQGHAVYGAVAGVRIEERADRYAYRQGLFVLTLGHDGLVRILNDAAFRPRDLSAELAPAAGAAL